MKYIGLLVYVTKSIRNVTIDKDIAKMLIFLKQLCNDYHLKRLLMEYIDKENVTNCEWQLIV